MTYDKTTKKKIMTYAHENGFANAIKKFSVSSATLAAWHKQEQPGYVKPARKKFFRKLNPDLLKVYVEENPDLTCAQYGQHFDVSDVAVLKCLHKLGFSFKKRTFSTKNEMKKNEPTIKKK